MANFLDQAKGQFSNIQGTVTETFNNVKTETEANAGKLKGQLSDVLKSAPEVVGSTTRDIKVKAGESASSTTETAKTEANNIATFFAGVFEKCCAPFNQKKD
ncbi:hypothetical protein FCM35_KLT10723 [Carex littledalei]|uniref:Uncharacterized protein n=1 Tax=Carex littledalei TaxID=544730 RepID=A0A833V404_9POAL|nr:hypothetical protein FCM35_KLT10723 [Carex littledalei]